MNNIPLNLVNGHVTKHPIASGSSTQVVIWHWPFTIKYMQNVSVMEVAMES